MRSIALYCVEFNPPPSKHQQLEKQGKRAQRKLTMKPTMQISKCSPKIGFTSSGSFLNQANTRIRCPSSFDPPLSLLSISHYLYQSSISCHPRTSLDILAQPPDALAVSLPHDDTAHEHLDGPDALEGYLALARGLVQAELVAQLVFRDGVGVVDLVAEDHKGHLGQLLHGEQRVELGLGLGEPLVVLRVDEEDDTVYFGEVVLPETAGCTS